MRIYRGNHFRDFSGEMSSFVSCNQVTGAINGADPNNAFDTRNPIEQVVLHYAGDVELFGVGQVARGNGSHGRYRIRIKFPAAAGQIPVPRSPCVAPPNGAGLLTTGSPSGDDLKVAWGKDGLSQIITSGPDGICNTAAVAPDVQLVGVGNFGQPFALAVA